MLDDAFKLDVFLLQPERYPPPALAQLVPPGAQHELTVAEECQLVGNAIDIGQNVGGVQNRVLSVLGDLPQDVQHLRPNHRVEIGSGLVQQQQPRPMGQSRHNGQFGSVAAR